MLLLLSITTICWVTVLHGVSLMDTSGTVTFVMINGFQELKYSLGMQLMPALSGCLYMLFEF